MKLMNAKLKDEGYTAMLDSLKERHSSDSSTTEQGVIRRG